MPHLDHPFINRQGATIEIEVDSEPINAFEGESVAAALTAAGKLKINHDKDGNGRGVFCGMGVCYDCLVGIDDGPTQRACMTKVHAGMRIRAAAYLAKPADRQEIQTLSTIQESPEVLIVGAGPSGMAAATSLTAGGILITILDERPSAGGQYYKQLAPGVQFTEPDKADQQYQDGAEIIKEVKESGAKLLTGVKVWGAFRKKSGEIEITATDDINSYVFRPRQVILATGAFEPVPLFPGWTLPGVMTTGAAQGLLRSYRVSPGDRVLIAGNGPLNLQLACELADAGVKIVAVAEAAQAPFPKLWRSALGALIASPLLMIRGLKMLKRLRSHGIPYLNSHIICETSGDGQVDKAIIAPYDGNKIDFGRQKEYDIDALCLGYGFQPVNELARTLGCEYELSSSGKMVPRCDKGGQTTIPGVYIIGDGATIGGAQVALAAGRTTANSVLNNLGRNTSVNSKDKNDLTIQRRFQKHLWNMYKSPEIGTALANEKTTICRCECVKVGAVKSLVNEGIHDPGTLKRLSRVGMGRCQGRYCQNHLSNLLIDMTGKRPTYKALFAPQIPIKPIAIQKLVLEAPEWKGYKPADIDSPSDTKPQFDEVLADTDVLIIGAGIIGVATAYYLTQSGIETTIIDKGSPNGQASGSNAGSMHLQLLSFDYNSEANRGPTPAEQTLSLQKKGVEAWLELERSLGADFELKITGGLMVAENDQDMRFLENKAKAERAHGIEMHILNKSELSRMAPAISDQMVGAAHCPDEGKINPMLATPAVLKAAEQKGANLISDTEVIRIEKEQDGYLVFTTKGKIKCKRIVNASGGWSSKIAAMVGCTLPVQSALQQMIVTEAAEPVIDLLVAHAHRHLTMKQAVNGNLIIGGGWFAAYDSIAKRPVTQREGIQGNLWVAQRVIPSISQLNILRTWGAVGVMIDGAPIIGAVPGLKGFYNAVGANGYTMAPVMGQMITEEIISNQSTVQEKLFSLERFQN